MSLGETDSSSSSSQLKSSSFTAVAFTWHLASSCRIHVNEARGLPCSSAFRLFPSISIWCTRKKYLTQKTSSGMHDGTGGWSEVVIFLEMNEKHTKRIERRLQRHSI